MSVLPAAARRPEPWRNGGGVTFEIARGDHPLRPGEFLWRVSIAEVSAAGPFSRFAGYERLIAVIEGAGMILRACSGPGGADAGAELARLAPFSVHRFTGDEQTHSELPQGAVKDLNVIFDSSLCRVTLALRTGPGGHVLAHRETIAINVSARGTHWNSATGAGDLAQFDALRLSGGGGRLEWRDPVCLALVDLDY